MNEVKNFFNLTLFLIIIFTCSDIDGIKKKNDNKHKTDLIFLLLAQNRMKGNCLRKDISTNINSCDRRQSGICNANDLILTSSEKKYNLNEANNLMQSVPSCSFSILNSGISSDNIASYSDEDTIRANNTYTVVGSCEETGMTSSASLLTESELLFANSARGRIGLAADKVSSTSDFALSLSLGSLTTAKQVKLDALDCLTSGFLQTEKDLFLELRTGKKTKALTCSTKSGAVNACL